MNREIKVSIESLGAEFTTDSPFKAFAFLTAVDDFNFDNELSQKISKLCNDVYISIQNPINGIDVVYYICENYHDLPNDFNDIVNVVFNTIIEYDL